MEVRSVYRAEIERECLVCGEKETMEITGAFAPAMGAFLCEKCRRAVLWARAKMKKGAEQKGKGE